MTGVQTCALRIFRIALDRALDDANLLTPTGESSTIPLPIPRVATAVLQLKGGVIIYAPKSLRVNPSGLQGLRTVSFADARQDEIGRAHV